MRLLENSRTKNLFNLLKEDYEQEINIDSIIGSYEYPPEIEPEYMFRSGGDSSYFTIVKTERDAERFNYHSDYWGSAEGYQEENVDLLANLESYIESGQKFYFMDDEDKHVFTITGVAIDRQYNSISHTKILIKEETPINEDIPVNYENKKERLIPTGLTDDRAKDVINAVVGQMSDGYWENSPGMERYWRFAGGLDDKGNIVIYDGYSRRDQYNGIDRYGVKKYKPHWSYSAFSNMDDTAVKKFFANKIKQLVKEEGLEWNRNNTEPCEYLDYDSGVTVRDAYRVYDRLLGRIDRITEEVSNKPNFVMFYLNGKELGGHDLENEFEGERESARELFAYENNVKPEDIDVKEVYKEAETYINKKELTDDEILQAAKYVLNNNKDLSKVFGWNNFVENAVWNYLKDKKGLKKFPSNLYKRIKKVIYNSPEFKDLNESARYAYNIDWETDGDEEAKKELPNKVRIPNNINKDDVADWLSDKYGWLVNSVSLEESLKEATDEEYEEYIKREKERAEEGYKDICTHITDEQREKFNGLKEMLTNESEGTMDVDGWYFATDAVYAVNNSGSGHHMNPYMDLTTSNILLMVGENDSIEDALRELFDEYKPDSAYSWADNFLYALDKVNLNAYQEFMDEQTMEDEMYENAENELVSWMYDNFPDNSFYKEGKLENGDVVYYFDDKGNIDKVKEAVKAKFGDEVSFGTARTEYAPEMREFVIICKKHKRGMNEAVKPKKEKKQDKRVVMQQGNVTCFKENDSTYYVFENESDNEVEYDNEDSAMKDFLERVGVDPNNELKETGN